MITNVNSLGKLCLFLVIVLLCIGDIYAGNDLINAVKTFDTQTLSKLLDNPKVDVNQTDAKGMTALMYAALYINEIALNRLLARTDIDLYKEDHNGNNVMMLVSEETGTRSANPRYKDILNLLIKARSERPVEAPFKKSCLITFEKVDYNKLVAKALLIALSKRTIVISNAFMLKKSLQIIFDKYPYELENFYSKKWTLFVNIVGDLGVIVPATIDDVSQLYKEYGFKNLRRIEPEKNAIESVLKKLIEKESSTMIESFKDIIDVTNLNHPTRVVLAGHGHTEKDIAGIEVNLIGNFLKVLTEVGAEFLYIMSCGVAGTNLLAMQDQIDAVIQKNLRANLLKQVGLEKELQVLTTELPKEQKRALTEEHQKIIDEKLSLLPTRYDYIIVVQATSDIVTFNMPALDVMFPQLNLFFTSAGLKQPVKEKRITINDIMKAVVPKDAFSLASIRFPGTTTFFRAADLGEMEIITSLRLKRLKIEVAKQIKPLMEQKIVIPIKPAIKFIQMFPCDAVDFTIAIEGPLMPKFISKIPGPAGHVIGKITYTSSQRSYEEGIKDLVEKGFWQVFQRSEFQSAEFASSDKCWFIKSIDLKIGSTQYQLDEVVIYLNAAKFTCYWMYHDKDRYYKFDSSKRYEREMLSSEGFALEVKKWVDQSKPSGVALYEATAGHENSETFTRVLDEFLAQ